MIKITMLVTILTALALALMVSGCASLPPTIEALSKDNAAVCATAPTPWGPVAIVRALLAPDVNVKVTASGGTCTMESTAK